MPLQKKAHLRWDPGGTDTDISQYVGGFRLSGQYGEEEVTTLADALQRYEKGVPEAQVTMTIRHDRQWVFRNDLWLPAFQATDDVVIAFRPEPTAVGTENPEYRVKVMVTEDEVGGTWGDQRRFEPTLRANEAIYSVDGASWFEYFTGQATSVF